MTSDTLWSSGGVKHITITESEEPIELPDHEGLLALAEAVRELQTAFQARAAKTHTRGDWGVVQCLDSAAYYLWGAMGELAKQEGLLK